MDRTELRKRWIMGIVQPELFYIPWGHKEEERNIYIRVVDTDGNPVNVTSVSLSYSLFQLYHNIEPNGSGGYTVVVDETNKGYAFNQDTEWRYPVPLPSQWEILPLPDFTVDRPFISGAEVTAYRLRVDYTFSARNLIEISNVYKGVYSITVQQPPNVLSMSYAPDYYNNYDSDHPVDRYAYQFDRNGKFSGFSFKTLYHPQYGYPNGYDFYCLTDKFRNNTLDVVCTRVPVVRYVVTWIRINNFTNREANLFFDNRSTHTMMHYGRIGLGIERFNSTYIPGKILAVKLYIDEQYRGCISLYTFGIKHYKNYQEQYTQTTTYGLPDVQITGGTITDRMLPYVGVYVTGISGHYKETVNEMAGFKNIVVNMNFRGSFYNNITKEMLENARYGYWAGDAIYGRNDCSDPDTTENVPSDLPHTQYGAVYSSQTLNTSVEITSVAKHNVTSSAYRGFRINYNINYTYNDNYYDVNRNEEGQYIGDNHNITTPLNRTDYDVITGSRIGEYTNAIPWTGAESAYVYTGSDYQSYYYTDGITPDEMFSYIQYMQYDTTTVEFEN